MDESSFLFRIFSKRVREVLHDFPIGMGEIEEVRLRAGAPLFVIVRNREYMAGKAEDFRVRAEDVEETLQCAARYSLYAFEEELKQGFLTIQGGHRIGVAGRVVTEAGKIKTIQPVRFLNIRFAHQIKGSADTVLPFLLEKETGCIRNTLFVSPPRCGKTTLLRDVIRRISDGRGQGDAGLYPVQGCSVGLVDERSEIAACFQGIPQNDVGMRTDVLDGCPKAQGMLLLLRSMAPEVIAVDEIGGEEDLNALRTVMNCGCRILATVHGASLEDIQQKPGLSRFLEEQRFERYVVLCSQNGPGTLHRICGSKGELICG